RVSALERLEAVGRRAAELDVVAADLLVLLLDLVRGAVVLDLLLDDEVAHLALILGELVPEGLARHPARALELEAALLQALELDEAVVLPGEERAARPVLRGRDAERRLEG